MKTEALPQTNNIKTLVTLEDKIDIERKGQQSVQGTLYVRFACFGNGSLHALYDKSNGFYRRQLLLTTKEKPVGRVDAVSYTHLDVYKRQTVHLPSCPTVWMKTTIFFRTAS